MPFARFDDWDDCMRKTRAKHPKWDTKRCEAYCGAIKHRVEDEPRGRRAARRSRR